MKLVVEILMKYYYIYIITYCYYYGNTNEILFNAIWAIIQMLS